MLAGDSVAQRLYIPQDQLKEDANICMHDLVDLDCQSLLLHCLEPPSNMITYGVNKIEIIYNNQTR